MPEPSPHPSADSGLAALPCVTGEQDATANATLGIAWARWFIPAAAAVLVLDQASKWWLQAQVVRGRLPNDWPSWLAWHHNPGVAWSLLDSVPHAVFWLTVALIPVLGVVWWRSFRSQGRCENLAFGLILGGALGNGIDRALAFAGQMPGVRDFLHVDLGFWPFHPWPTFNIADSGITIGFVILLARNLRRPVAAPATTDAAGAPQTPCR